MLKKIINFVSNIYWLQYKTPIEYAKHIGVKVGNNTWINTRKWSSEPFLITIGNNCQVTEDVSFHTHGGGNCVRRKCPDFDCFGKIVVEDWAYIGAFSHIMPGVTIGEGALVAAGSVVVKSVPPHTVVGGNPAKVICSTDDYLERNLKWNLGTKKLSTKEKIKLLKQLPEDKFIKK